MGKSHKKKHCSECAGWACEELENISKNTPLRIIVNGIFPIQAADGSEVLLFEDVDNDNCAIFRSPSTGELFRIDCNFITVILIPAP